MPVNVDTLRALTAQRQHTAKHADSGKKRPPRCGSDELTDVKAEKTTSKDKSRKTAVRHPGPGSTNPGPQKR